MNNSKQAKKTASGRLVFNAFMKSPIPLFITTVKDGTCVEINDAGVRYIGWKRENIIGHDSVENGIMTKEQRKFFINEIKKDGFVRNIPLKFKVGNHVVEALCASYLFKWGNKEFLFNFIYSIPSHKLNIKSSEGDLFYKLALLDLKYIKDRLKQYKLTHREKEITLLSAAGKSNRTIAKELYISEHTVKDHLKVIFHIIGIHHRSELLPKFLNLC